MDYQTKILIDGELVEGAHSLEVIDPSTGTPFITVGRASEDQLNDAVAAAKRAQPAWAATPRAERSALLHRFADILSQNADALARCLVQEQGKPLQEALGEIQGADTFIRYFADLDLPPQLIRDDEHYRIETRHKPLGVVAGITPWNFPVLIGMFKMAPALITGNTFILKPPATTPATSLMIGALAQTIFPKGVFNVIVDNNDLGAKITAHPDIAKISFTGSTATGKKVMASGAGTLKRITLELGGNDASIVLEDIDVKATAPKIFGSAFYNAGQVCTAIKRVYVHASIYDDLVAELARLADEAVVGNGLEQGTAIGPLQNSQQFQKAKAYLEKAGTDGIVVAGGSAAPGNGYYIRPTIVRDIPDDSDLVREEQFAPILPIMKFEDDDDVVSRVNDSEFGLGGSIWTNDIERAERLASRIDSGTVWINQHMHFDPSVPFPGAKQSGIGVELSLEGLAEYTQLSVIDRAK